MASAAIVDIGTGPDDHQHALMELLSDCTCPICQEVYTNPHQLGCGHTFCLGCYEKLKHKWRKSNGSSSSGLSGLGGGGNGRSAGDRMLRLSAMLSMSLASRLGSGSGSSGGDQLNCPVCRSAIDPYKPVKPDTTASALITALKAVKAGRCKQPDCWRQARVACDRCACGLCEEHHRERLDELRAGCAVVAEEAERYLLGKTEEAARLPEELLAAETQLADLERQLSQAMQEQLDRCRRHLSQARLDWTEEQRELQATTDALRGDAAQLRQLLGDQPDAIQVSEAMTRQRRQLEQRLRAARVRFPPSQLLLGFEPAKLAAEHASVLAGVSGRLLKRPYCSSESADKQKQRLKPSQVKRTKRGEPWEVRLMLDGRLLVNYKGFPTRRLHVFSADTLAETGAVDLQMTETQFPGQTCVCNSRQRIFASDPKNHCVYAFDFSGVKVATFGEKGTEPGQMHSPKGMCAHEGILYLADSKNKRVQLFDMADDAYRCLGCLEHESLGDSIQAVLAGDECVLVCVRGNNTLVVFDRETRRYLRHLPAGGEPFDACADQFGNLLVSLTQERKIKVFDPVASRCIATLDVAPAEGESHESGSLKNYLHGMAYDPNAAKLYVVEAFAKRLMAFYLC